jgi:hypothetical protein
MTNHPPSRYRVVVALPRGATTTRAASSIREALRIRGLWMKSKGFDSTIQAEMVTPESFIAEAGVQPYGASAGAEDRRLIWTLPGDLEACRAAIARGEVYEVPHPRSTPAVVVIRTDDDLSRVQTGGTILGVLDERGVTE